MFWLKRDAYYKYKQRADKRLKLEQQVLELVHKRRRSLPREGVRKLQRSWILSLLKPILKLVEIPCSTS
jgi:putative transposase